MIDVKVLLYAVPVVLACLIGFAIQQGMTLGAVLGGVLFVVAVVWGYWYDNEAKKKPAPQE